MGEMLFVVIGTLVCGALAHWTVGTPLRRFNPYSFTITLAQAPGVVLGTPLRMKGVPMGSVLSATAGLDRVSIEVEVNEAKTIIPRGSRFELTQSGMIPAASIDISPPEGVSAESLTALVAAQQVAREAAAREAAAGSGEKRAKRAARVRLAGPKDVEACRLQGVLVCQGDSVEGIQGGSMDELMAHTLRGLRQGEGPQTDGVVPGRGPLQG
ncbi:hypothetical protein GPECTOR_2g1484 [Gonium pectorale]|uniref:Mce/MlaD domain-containing protein n=1 Tax=Gonium pectorale TaxID=33097 RepID=A0A150H1N6_GONPE|nr:hypothetical protein GPECTOR_2g1484 [Gonium pectorale]|eukprot:KXZ55933.1 hypothetical protein GPECTOR_2g1484 [Gonium pectorale]